MKRIPWTGTAPISASTPVSPKVAALMLATAAFLTCGLAMRSEPSQAGYQFTSDAELDRRIGAYLPFVLMAEKEIVRHEGRCSAATAEKVGAAWALAAHRGELQGLYRAYYEDDVASGLTGQIILVQNRLGMQLLSGADGDLDRRQPARAARRALTALRVVRSTYYSDPETMMRYGSLLRRSYDVLDRSAPGLTAADRQHVVRVLKESGPDLRQFGHMGFITARLLDETASGREFKTPAVFRFGFLGHLLRVDPGQELDAMSESVRDLEKLRNTEVESLAFDLQNALNQEIRNEKTRRATIARLERGKA